MISVRNVTRTFGERVVLNDISFEVGKGEVVGFLGLNGAGKTTTMRILTGYLMPTRGDVSIAGHDILREPLEGRRHVGYLPELAPLYLDMTTRAYLRFAGRLRGLASRAAARRIDELLPMCGITEYADTLLGKLSKGYRQRVGLAQAIVHDPPVLILDEPTAGIDPVQIVETRALISELGRTRTILLSTHVLPEVTSICDSVIIISGGRIVAHDRIANLSPVLDGARRLRLAIQGPPEEVSRSLRAIPEVLDVRFEAPFHLVSYREAVEPQVEINRRLVSGGWTLRSMEADPVSLESVFVSLAGGSRP